MKRGGRAVKERDALRKALASIPALCPDCPTGMGRVEWAGSRYVVAVYHFESCPVHRSAWSQRCCEDYLRAKLRLYGTALPDYDHDGELITHRAH